MTTREGVPKKESILGGYYPGIEKSVSRGRGSSGKRGGKNQDAIHWWVLG